MAPSDAGALLERVYVELDLVSGRLMRPSQVPRGDVADEWAAVGDWLSLASRMDADRIFFVGDDPVLVFAAMPPDADEAAVLRAYRKAWSLARPRCLFVATSDELRVYALSDPPPADGQDGYRLDPLEVVERTADVARALRAFHRDRVESGEAFAAIGAPAGGWADRQLILDVAHAAERLKTSGLPASIAHGLIERAILVRYLEDRGIVTRDFIKQIAEADAAWWRLITIATQPSMGPNSTFVACLEDLDLTYTLFTALEHEFNGDLFAVPDEEKRVISQEHLCLLRGLLTRGQDDLQQPLFLWAYDFSVVPTALLSSMYEHFYHVQTGDDAHSTHFTPPELVEHVTAAVLTTEVLSASPSVCDPACGSGVFLVEAFRRIVRHEMAARGDRLPTEDLKSLLLTRVTGIDINAEAVRLAAFSLYLAYLNYQTVNDIRAAGPLPPLIYDESRHGSVLIVADAFDEGPSDDDQPWPTGRFDVVIGNPPWDEPRGSGAVSLAERWVANRGLQVGDRSPSQLFIWRSLDLLKPGGKAGLLIHASVFHNTRSTSQQFRRAWISAAKVTAVTDFSLVRRHFFVGAIAPFCLAQFEKGLSPTPEDWQVCYLSARPAAMLPGAHSFPYVRLERRLVAQSALRDCDYLWKVYAWGNHHDEALMRRMDLEIPLKEFLPPSAPAPGYGYQLGSGRPSPTLTSLPSLRTFEPWGDIRPEWIEPPPAGVKRQPGESLYHGRRLLVRRGVRAGFGPLVRLEDKSASFRHNTYCIPLGRLPRWKAELLLGILLSSLGRYRVFFMTSGSWGVWHDSVLAGDLLNVPVPEISSPAQEVMRVCTVVRRIQRWVPSPNKSHIDEAPFVAESRDEHMPHDLLRLLNDAVYDLYRLTDRERDLVEDWLRYSLPLTQGKIPGRLPRGVSLGDHRNGDPREVPPALERYLEVFVDSWDREIRPKGEMTWTLISPADASTIAILFRVLDARTAIPRQYPAPLGTVVHGRWLDAVRSLDPDLTNILQRRFVVEGIVRTTGTDFIVIAKKDEERLWSASTAREDFEATLVQAMRMRRA